MADNERYFFLSKETFFFTSPSKKTILTLVERINSYRGAMNSPFLKFIAAAKLELETASPTEKEAIRVVIERAIVEESQRQAIGKLSIQDIADAMKPGGVIQGEAVKTALRIQGMH